MASKEKLYIRGNSKEVEFKNGSSLVNFSVNLDELEEILKIVNARKRAADYKESRFLNLSISRRKAPDQYKNTHTVWINEMFLEDEDISKIKGRKADAKAAAKASSADDGTDEIPF